MQNLIKSDLQSQSRLLRSLSSFSHSLIISFIPIPSFLASFLGLLYFHLIIPSQTHCSHYRVFAASCIAAAAAQPVASFKLLANSSQWQFLFHTLILFLSRCFTRNCTKLFLRCGYKFSLFITLLPSLPLLVIVALSLFHFSRISRFSHAARNVISLNLHANLQQPQPNMQINNYKGSANNGERQQ